ncbi:MAG: FecR family protein [Halieaceae bacterium]|jgi:transmembrane sensor|nr:FecR family protein [Halieaceae bacterium]
MDQSTPGKFDTDCDEALGWIARLRAGSASDLDRQGFALWLAEDASHKQAMDAMLEMWDDLASVRYLPVTAIHSRPAANRDKWLAGALATAACLVVALLLWPQGFSENKQWNYQTNLGEQRSFELADSSRLSLNTASRVQVTYNDERRYVELIQGEAYFEVAKDSSRPFEVELGSARVTAIGTAFNIYRDDMASAITVTEGVVRVTELGDTGGRAPMVEVLHANQQLTANTMGLQASSKVDVAELIAWRRGELIANEMPLPELVAQIERYNGTHILITDSNVAALTVSGVFELNQPRAILDALELSLDLKVVTLDPQTLQLLKSPQ